MNSEQRKKIRDLVQKYAVSGTESLITFVAETDGMLAACQAMLHSLEAVGSTSTEWLQRECSEEDVTFHSFLQEISKIVVLFQPSRNIEDHRATLEVAADAGIDEIKQAYRILSRRYHPDTAAPPYRDNPEKFIAINKAYHALLGAATGDEKDQGLQQGKQWRRKKERTVSPEQRKKVFTWTLGLLIVLVVVSAIASMNFKKRAMLAGLQEGRGAFIPPARQAAVISTDKEHKVENKPVERPAPIVTTVPPKQESVVKVQVEPPVDSLTVKVLEPPYKEPGKEIAAQLATGNNALKIKPVNQGLAPAINYSNSTAVAAVAADKPSQPAAGAKRQATRKEQAKDIEADVVFNSTVPASAAIIAGGKVEKEAQLTHAKVTEIVPLPAADPFPKLDKPKQEKPDMQARVDRFFANYTKAYEQRNLILFSRFFEAEAEENGKQFTAMLPTYLDLFAVTSRVSMRVEQRSLRLTDDSVAVDGVFKVSLEYKDGRTVNGSGPISFVLVDNNGELLIKKMQYVFHTE